MDPTTLTRRAIRLAALLPLLLLGSGLAQEACLKGCAYPPYPGLFFTLGDGFVAKGGEEVKVTHMGFLGWVYNNDGITPRKVGVPDYIGELYVIDPVTGEQRFLFRNQHDWVTHANDSGRTVSLGVYPKGAPVVFMYRNVDGKTNGYKTFPRYSGDNAAGTYDFDADPVLRTLAINGRPRPVSGGTWNWEGKDHAQWCVAADVPGTGEKQFQFEDADDRIFNDIVFRVSGVALVSETYRLGAPVFSGSQGADGRHRVGLAMPAGEINQGARIFYTEDGSTPSFDSAGNARGTTKVYTGTLDIARTTTLKAAAWKATATTSAGGVIRYVDSPVAERTFTVLVRRKLSAPAASPPGGGFTGPVTVSLSQAEGAPIYFRLCDVGAACPDPDASASAYAAPFSISSPKVLKAIAIQAPHADSEVASWTFEPVYRLLGAVYLDRDGDGRIDAARLAFDRTPATLPPAVVLEDPFSPGTKRKVPMAALRLDPAVPGTLWAEFPSRPCEPGTGFMAGPYGLFAEGDAGYDSQAFTLRDGVGPVVRSAEAAISLEAGGAKSLVVAFSEPLSGPGGDGALPFTVKRGAEDITPRLRVSAVEPAGPDAWRYTFVSDVFPVPGDSLKASPAARDAGDNASNMAYHVAVGGSLAPVTAKLTVKGGGCARGGALPAPTAWVIPVNVVVPRPTSSEGCVDAGGEVECLDCRSGEWRRLDPRRPTAGTVPGGPEIQVTSRWPFAFDLRFFNTLGEFVNSARGTVTEEMLAGAPADAAGYRTVGLRWHPVSEAGQQAGTGAYIVKGRISVNPPSGRVAVQGVPVAVAPAAEAVNLRFGYLRD